MCLLIQLVKENTAYGKTNFPLRPDFRPRGSPNRAFRDARSCAILIAIERTCKEERPYDAHDVHYHRCDYRGRHILHHQGKEVTGIACREALSAGRDGDPFRAGKIVRLRQAGAVQERIDSLRLLM